MLDFNDIYAKNRAKVYGQCLRQTRNPADAEDLTSEVFLKVWKNLSNFRGDSLISTWIYSIARTTILMSVRGKRSRAKHTECSELYSQRESPELKITLVTEIARLPNRQRDCFILHHIEGKEFPEIAAQRNITESAAKAACLLGRNKLKKVLDSRARI